MIFFINENKAYVTIQNKTSRRQPNQNSLFFYIDPIGLEPGIYKYIY